MNFLSMKKGPDRQSSPYGQVKGSITESTTHHSYISFNPNSQRTKHSQLEPPDNHPKKEKFLHIISKPAIKITPSPSPHNSKTNHKQALNPFEGFCACLTKSEESQYPKIKDARSARQDLSSLLTSKVEEKKEQHCITPINSLLNLLDE